LPLFNNRNCGQKGNMMNNQKNELDQPSSQVPEPRSNALVEELGPQPAPVQEPVLVRDVAEVLGVSVPEVSAVLVKLGQGPRSTNMAISGEELLAVAAELKVAQQPAQQQEPGRNHWEDGDVFERIAEMKKQPAQQEPVAWPAGLIERIKAAEQRIQDGHAPRRIPADPTDVDLVLAEVRYLLESKQPPFWVSTSPPAQQERLAIEHCIWARNGNTPCPHTSPPAQRKRLTDLEISELWLGNGYEDSSKWHVFHFARRIEAALYIKENT
jgi:hypothetical protein